jgi:hypothetical protein
MCLGQKNSLENKNKIIQYSGPPVLLYGSETWTVNLYRTNVEN